MKLKITHSNHLEIKQYKLFYLFKIFRSISKKKAFLAIQDNKKTRNVRFRIYPKFLYFWIDITTITKTYN